MHIITGLLLAGLAGAKKGRPRSPVARFRTGPIQTAHWLPGRVRFRVPSLVGNEQAAAIVLDRIRGIAGVESVLVDETSGSVLIGYREENVRPELLFAALARLLDLEKELQRTPQPVITRELRSAMDGLNRAVYHQTGGLLDFWSALLIALAAVGTTKVVSEGARAFPPAFTLLWWALNPLAGRRGD